MMRAPSPFWVTVGLLLGTGIAVRTAVAQSTFTPGSREIVSLSFATVRLGEFPTGLKLLSGSLEVVEKDGVRMVRAATPSEFLVTLPEVLPEDFTIEFDFIPKQCCNPEDLAFEGTATLSRSSTSAQVLWHRESQRVVGGGGDYQAATPATLRETLPGQLAKIIASFEGNTLKLYTNGQRLYTLADRRFARGRVLRVFLGGQDDDEQAVYLARLRIAAGAGSVTTTVASSGSASSSQAPVTVMPVATQSGTITPTSSSPQTGSTSGVSTVTTMTQPAGTMTPMDPAVAGVYAPTGVEVAFSTETRATVSWKAPVIFPSGSVIEMTGWSVRWNLEADEAICFKFFPGDAAKCPSSESYGTDKAMRSYEITPLKAGARYVVRVWEQYFIVSGGSGEYEGFPSAAVAMVYNQLLVTRPPTIGTPTVMSNGPAAVIAPITGDQGSARIRWTGPAGAVNYIVMRRIGSNAPEQLTPTPISASAYDDAITDVRASYQYQVVAKQTDGRSGTSEWASFSPPALVNPTGFSGRQIGASEVTLTWQKVPGAVGYRTDGAGLPSSGVQVADGFLNVEGLPAGAPLNWQVAAVFPANQMDLATRPTATVTLSTVPWRTVRWLTMRNGAGSFADQLGYYTEMITRPEKCTAIYPWDCLTAMDLIVNFPVDNAFRSSLGLRAISPDGSPVFQGTFADLRDMGAGRHVMCSEHKPLVPGPPGSVTMETLCWASTHGPLPGTAGWGDPETALAAVAGGNPNRGWTFIRQGMNGPLFAAFEGLAGATGEYAESQYGKPKLESGFDVEGPKKLPHACLACHGGRYDPSTKRVVDASLIPLDPSVLVFPGKSPTRPEQEESIRRINMIVLNSNPSPAVAAYIRGLYGGAPDVPGTRANDTYIPDGWAQAPDLYRKVVKPYCQGCHLQQTSRTDFASYQNFFELKAAIQTTVCTQRSMPHAEAPFLAFWRDGKGESLPDYLMAALGLGKCGP